MELLTFEKDLVIFYIQAESYPMGIGEAHQKLQSLVPDFESRKKYGISFSDGQRIIYRAGAEELKEGEGEELGCETFTVRAGDFISEVPTNWTGNTSLIQSTFEKLLANPDIDKENGYCLEIYDQNILTCAVPLKRND